MGTKDLQEKLEGLRRGDGAAFEELYHALKTPMYTVILRITRDQALAEDVLQEVFIKLYRSPPTPPIKNPRAYLLRIARNLAIDHVRKQPQFADLGSIEDLPALPTDDVSFRMDVDHAMKTLPLQDCQIVSLRINGECTFREIADMMGIPLGTVLWRYQKAVGTLRSILSGGAV